MINKDNQHKLGQHYSKESDLINQYNTLLKEKRNLTIVDPFCGEGHLIFHYLGLFTFPEQLEILNKGKIIATDISIDNVNFVRSKLKDIYDLNDKLINKMVFVNDSLLSSDIFPNDTFILTNPPYLAKNVLKRKYPNDFNSYFLNKFSKLNDFFEISLTLYSKYDGVWIVPANLFSSDLMVNIRKSIFNKLDNITIYKIKTFDDTGISVCTFNINNNLNEKTKTFNFISNKGSNKTTFKIFNDGSIVKEWSNIKSVKNTAGVKQGYIRENIKIGDKKVILLNEKYKPETFYVSSNEYDKLSNNTLILRTTDTGSESGKIGLYTIKEIWNDDNAIGLITKTSSRVYVQLFFNSLNTKEQLKLKEEFNKKINNLREKHESIFLTNYKNVSNNEQRKRISFKESFALINHILNNKK